jgi:hypothetical protein
MSRLILLFVVAALVIPGAASAMAAGSAAQDAKWRAVEEYYSSYGEPKPIAAPTAPEPVADDGGLSVGTIGIGVGLMLLAGGLGVYAGRSLRPRHIGA